MIYMFLSNNPSSGDINSSNLPCCSLNCIYLVTHQFLNLFWVLKRDGSLEYPQHMFWFRNKKFFFLVCTLNLLLGMHVSGYI